MISRPHKLSHDTQPGRSMPVITLTILLLSAATSQSQTRYSGGSGTREDPYLISSPSDLLALAADANDWAGYFRLTNDIDMAEVPRDTVCMIGNATIPFKGSFDGAGKRILHYTCVLPGRNRVGLFGHIRALNGGVRDLCLIDPNVQGPTGISVGALVGHLGTGEVLRCRVEGGHVSGYSAVGGLVGWTYTHITGCTATAEVRGQYSVGGLVGLCAWDAQVRDCAADANVAGISRVGGLAGACTGAIVEWSSARGFAAGSSYVGGLVGCGEGATVANCYSTTSTEGNSIVGGLAGCNGLASQDSNSLPGMIRNCYSIGLVIGLADAGGFAGINEPDCIIEGAFWDIQTSGMNRSDGGTGLPTALLQTPTTFAHTGWDFSQKPNNRDYWTIDPGPQYPTFAWQIPVSNVSAPTAAEP